MISLDSLSRHSKTEVGPWLNPVIDFAKGVMGSEHFVEGDILESCALIQSEEGGGVRPSLCTRIFTWWAKVKESQKSSRTVYNSSYGHQHNGAETRPGVRQEVQAGGAD